jgi:hypothetical protein
MYYSTNMPTKKIAAKSKIKPEKKSSNDLASRRAPATRVHTTPQIQVQKDSSTLARFTALDTFERSRPISIRSIDPSVRPHAFQPTTPMASGVSAMARSRKKGSRPSIKRISIMAGCALLVLLGGYFLWVSLLEGTAQTPEQKKEAYIANIAKKITTLALVPESEVPQIGVIPDPAKIKENKEFFVNAIAGDYLVYYPHARLMLIYSPTKGVVVNMRMVAEGGDSVDSKRVDDKK